MADLKKESKATEENQSVTDDSKTTTVAKNTKSTSQKKTEKKTTNSNKPSRAVSYLAIIVSLSALGLSGWQFYQDFLNQGSTTLVDLKTSQQKLNTMLDGQQASLSNLQTKVTNQINSQLITQVKPTLDKLAQDNQFTQDNNTRVNFDISVLKQQFKKLDNATKEDWKLAEAEYLIRLSNQKLLMEKDIIGATQMLINADDILTQLDDPLLFNTRKALASDIEKLKATPSFDLEGLYLQLDALTTQINSLPQKGHQRRAKEENNNATSNGEGNDDLINILWATLKSLVIIQHHNKPIEVLLEPTDYQQLILNIQMQINAAQLALLKQEPIIYKTALAHISTIITEVFDLNSIATQSFLNSITSLQEINPSPDLPLPRDSLIEIKTISAAWHNTTGTETTK